MTPFYPAIIPQSEREAMYQMLLERWRQHDSVIRAGFANAQTEAEAKRDIKAFMRECGKHKTFRNDTYQVEVAHMGNDPREHAYRLSIKRIDRQPIHDWRELQAIKSAMLGPECEAVELYPAESRLVDTANQYYLWGFKDPNFRFPFGFDNGRHQRCEPFGKAVNRPFYNEATKEP